MLINGKKRYNFKMKKMRDKTKTKNIKALEDHFKQKIGFNPLFFQGRPRKLIGVKNNLNQKQSDEMNREFDLKKEIKDI